MSFNVVFLGTAPFGFPVMRALRREDRVSVQGVITQPDRERGRGRETQSPPVADFARELDLPLYQPEDINDDGLDQCEPIDFGIVIAYGQILSSEVLEVPERGFYNFHASLLPRWRGASPIRHALMAGDTKTGTTVFQVEEDLDTGPVCVRLETPVRSGETYGELYERLSQINVGALNVLLSDLESGNISFRPQEGEVSYAPQIDSDEARIQWDQDAESISNTIRAFCPDPGAYTFFQDDRIKIYEAVPYPGESSKATPGEIVQVDASEIHVAAGSGTVGVGEVQKAGSRRMDVEAFLAGHSDLDVGERFESQKTATS
ncbi:MAG: methionyl-tRNA formyltransferase [bacterium]